MHVELAGPALGVVDAMRMLAAFMLPLMSGAMGWWSFISARRILRTGLVRLGAKTKLSRKEHPGIFWYFVIGQFAAAVFFAFLTIAALVVAWMGAHEP
jgi:hypothetical protein